jgi:uncharacterized protein
MTHEAGAEREFRNRLAEGRFGIQTCLSCTARIFFPRVVCPECGGVALEWRESPGRGVVYSTTVVRRRKEDGGDYNVAIVQLDEGPRMMSRVDGVAPDAVTIGMRVVARLVDVDGLKLVTFAPAGQAQ